MIIDGRSIAAAMLGEIASEVAVCGRQPHLSVLTCAPNFATKKFLNIKSKAAEQTGTTMVVTNFDDAVTTADVIDAVKVAIATTDGIIMQLPFPESVDVDAVLAELPASHDVDAIGHEAKALLQTGESIVLPPVVGAISEIVLRHKIEIENKNVVVIGNGRLVGAPASIWFEKKGATVTVLDRKTTDITSASKDADILVLGAGVPRMIIPEMITERVVIFDAGTSEDSGELVGDADPSCAAHASLFTPVPGGIGPITIAVIFKNLLELIRRSA